MLRSDTASKENSFTPQIPSSDPQNHTVYFKMRSYPRFLLVYQSTSRVKSGSPLLWRHLHNLSQAGLLLQILYSVFFFFSSSFFLASCGRADGKFWCHQPWHSGTEEHADPQGATIGAHVFVPRRWWNRWCGAARLCCTCVPACWLISLVMWNVTICSPVPLTPSCVNANHWQEDSYLSHVKSGAWRWAICQQHLKCVLQA